MSKSRPDVSKMTHGFFITINGDTGSCFNSTHEFLLSDPRVAGQLVRNYDAYKVDFSARNLNTVCFFKDFLLSRFPILFSLTRH